MKILVPVTVSGTHTKMLSKFYQRSPVDGTCLTSSPPIVIAFIIQAAKS